MKSHISARQFRPQSFEEVVGQRHLVQILTQAVLQEKTAQAYLFSGMRGVGKTTVARILAKALNCSGTETRPQATSRPCNQCTSCQEITEDHAVDVIQIDGASNTSVDDVRELREIAKYLPLRGKYKIIIIDEVHMLSNAAFNALLKILEEPPSHLVFIMATTEAHKIPATILSRCQHFIFRRITRVEMEGQLRKVLAEKGMTIPHYVLTFIVKASEGSMRDALSLLDQVLSFGGQEITEETLSTLFGRVAGTVSHALIRGIHEKDAGALLCLARTIEDGGYDLRQFLLDWTEHLRHLLVIQHVKNGEALIDLPDEEKREIEKESGFFSKEELHRLFSLFIRLQEEIRNAPRPHLLFEVALMKSILLADLEPIEKIIAQLESQPHTAVTTGNVPNANYELRIKNQGQPVSTPAAVAVPLPIKTETTTASMEKSPQAGAMTSASPQRPQTSLHPTKVVSGSPLFEGWSQLLQEVKKERRALASYLEQGKVLDITDQTIKIGFSEEASFLISLIEKEENKKWLHSLLKHIFKRDMQMILVPALEVTAPREKVTDPRDHPLVREALRVFEKAVITT